MQTRGHAQQKTCEASKDKLTIWLTLSLGNVVDQVIPVISMALCCATWIMSVPWD